MIEKQLKPYSIEQGIDSLLYFGLKHSKWIFGEIDFTALPELFIDS
jgi:hypothetical protein